MALLTQADLAPLNKAFDDSSPADLLRWAKGTFGERVAILSAMQMAGSVVCHLVHSLKLRMPVVFVDTGVNFQETLETRDRISREYGLPVITLHPELSMEEQTRQFGVLYLSHEGQMQCCDMRKSEPLRQAKGRFDALVGGLRRADGGRRDAVPVLAVDEETNTVRVNPLANMSDENLAEYIAQYQVIVNPLHYQGFATIGCNRCTTPVLANEPKRAGRWRHLGPWSAYCGINPTDRSDRAPASVDLPEELVDRILGRSTDFSI